MTPDAIRQILEAGGNVELESQYPVSYVDQWIALAVTNGGRLLVSGPYPSAVVIAWAKKGGRHFTYRVPRT